MSETTLADRLPRRIRAKQQCQALDENGRRCSKQAVLEAYYFGNPEHDSPAVWAIVAWCADHAGSNLRELSKSRKRPRQRKEPRP